MVQNESPTSIHQASTLMDMLRGKWHGVFYSISNLEFYQENILFDYKCRITKPFQICSGRVKHFSFATY